MDMRIENKGFNRMNDYRLWWSSRYCFGSAHCILVPNPAAGIITAACGFIRVLLVPVKLLIGIVKIGVGYKPDSVPLAGP